MTLREAIAVLLELWRSSDLCLHESSSPESWRKLEAAMAVLTEEWEREMSRC